MPIASVQTKSVAEKRSTDPQTSLRRKRLKKNSSGSFGSTPSSSIEEVELLGPNSLKSEGSVEVIRSSSLDKFQNGSQNEMKTNPELFATVSLYFVVVNIFISISWSRMIFNIVDFVRRK